MREYNFIKDSFLVKHKDIDNQEYLDKYINFLLNYNLDININYTEKHHILPKSAFPEYINEEWNIIELSYDDHKNVHLWIFKAINCRKYQRPLNWMMNYYKNTEETSKAAKRGWINLKNDKTKYDIWCDKRSEYMKTLTPEEQRRRANIFWNNITDEEYLKFSNKIKEYWTTDKRIEKSNQLKEYYSNPENVEKKRIESKKKWDSRSIEERDKFSKKMSNINKDEDKRKDAGAKIKKLWEDPIYLEKMKNRKHKSVPGIKIILSNGDEYVYSTMGELSNEKGLSLYLIRKYRDTNEKILEKDLKKNNILLLNSIIETIKK